MLHLTLRAPWFTTRKFVTAFVRPLGSDRVQQTMLQRENGNTARFATMNQRESNAQTSQSVDYTILSALASEVQEYLPTKVVNVSQDGDTAINIRLLRESVAESDQTQKPHNIFLMLNWHKKYSRFCLKSDGSISRGSAFASSVQEIVKDLYLIRVEVLPFQRVVRFDFSSNQSVGLQDVPSARSTASNSTPVDDEAASLRTAQIYLEASGGEHSRVVLVNLRGRVLTAAPAIDQSGVLWSRIGSMYSVPAAGDGAVPSLNEQYESWRSRIASPDKSDFFLRQVLLKQYVGLSVPLIFQMLGTAGIPSDETVATTTEEDLQRLWSVWRGWLWFLEDRNFVPVVLEEGKRFSVVPWPSASSEADHAAGDDDEVAPPALAFQTVSDCVDWFFALAEVDELKSYLLRQVDMSLQSQRRKISDFRRKLEEAQEAQKFKHAGELLSANQHLVVQGMASIKVQDWGSMTEGDVEPPLFEISLDPTLSGPENAIALFKRFKKLTRQGEAVRQLLNEATLALMELIQVQEVLANVPRTEGPQRAMAVLQSVKDRLVAQRFIRGPGQASPDRAQARAKELVQHKAVAKKRPLAVRGRDKAPEFLRFTSPSGLDVIAGRSRHDNERLTWDVARDRDVWLHARGVGGSHVILRAPQSGAVSQEDLVFAAGIAAFYSKASKDTKVDVSYTLRKHLRPPPARIRKPGMVQITKEEVVTVRPLDCTHLSQ